MPVVLIWCFTSFQKQLSSLVVPVMIPNSCCCTGKGNGKGRKEVIVVHSPISFIYCLLGLAQSTLFFSYQSDHPFTGGKKVSSLGEVFAEKKQRTQSHYFF